MSGTRIRKVSRKVRQRRTIVGGAAALLAAAIMTNSGITLASWTDSEQLDGGNGNQQVGSGECDVTTTGLVSSSWSRFLSGEIGQQDLNAIAGISQLNVANGGTAAPAVSDGNPLGDDAFDDDITPQLGGTGLANIGLEVQNGTTTGAYTQWAQARNNGRPYAATGAVTDDGAVELESPDSTPPSVGVLKLSQVLSFAGTDFANSVAQLADLELRIGAVDSNIEYYGCEQVWKTPVAGLEGGYVTRDGRISDLGLAFTSPALSSLYTATNELLDLNALQAGIRSGAEGDLTELLQGLTGLALQNESNDPVYIHVNFPDDATLTDVLQSSVSSENLAVDLAAGTVTFDLAEFAGDQLRDPDPNTLVLGPDQMSAINTELQSAITARTLRVEDALRDYLDAITVDIRIPVKVEVAVPALPPVTPAITATVHALVAGDDLPLDQLENLEITTNVTTSPDGALGSTVTALTDPVVALLRDSLRGLLGDLGPALDANLDQVFASTGTDLDETLGSTTGLIGNSFASIQPLIRITANVQPELGATADLAPHDDVPTFATVSALRIQVLGAGTSTAELADVWLATSGVGPVASVNAR